MKLNVKRTIFVGFAFFLISIFWQAYDTIVPKVLTDKFGLSQTISGLVMAMDNLIALVMLPLFGAFSDHCRSKYGRRTPYIFVGTILSVILFFTLSFADNMQLTQVAAVDPQNPTALETLYDADLSINDPDGIGSVAIQDEFTREEFTKITMTITDESGSSIANPDYNNYVVPARHAFAWQQTIQNPAALIFFMAVLFFLLLSMSIFRSPAVALMPDVTIKPLRSKGNAIINLMGSAGGILVLVLGIIFGTGKSSNALMRYQLFFSVVAALMLLALLVFLLKVREPQFVREMEEESRKYGLTNSNENEPLNKGKKLSRSEFTSLLLILSSVVLWFMGYNAVTSKYSVYAGSVLGLDYNTTLILAQAAAILAYLPVGIISSKIGRKKAILSGIVMLTTAFVSASFLRAGSSLLLVNILFALAGIGWATINVNSFPMVVELSRNGDVGKYTGFYYTASMAAQTITPVFSGIFLDNIGMTTLFPYASVFAGLAFVTMFFVRHGDSKPTPTKNKLEAFDTPD